MGTSRWWRSLHRGRWLAGFLCGAWTGGWLPLVASAALTERVSVDSLGTQGNHNSSRPALSADGRVVAFESSANLAAGDSNGASHIFVHDRQSGQTTRVSISSTGAQGNHNSSRPALSADGRFVAFESVASNLVPGDSNGVRDIFVHDRQSGQTTRVSVSSGRAQANARSVDTTLSADGRVVAFTSYASNLVLGDTNGVRDIFVHDRQSGQTTRVSISSTGAQGNHNSSRPALSADGRFVAFVSWSNLVPEDTNDVEDIFVHDRQSGETTRVSVSSTGAQVNSSSFGPALSADGRFVAFTSFASHLVAGDGNNQYDIFIHDRQNGETARVSVSSAGAPGNGGSYNPAVSADGRFVAFDSYASTLVPEDTNGAADIFVHDRQTGVTTRLSVDSAGTEANASSFRPTLSADGRVVAFDSDASNLVPGDTNSAFDIFAHEREGLGEFVATVTGLEPERVWCHNLTTGQQVGVDPEGATAWDCVGAGLAIAPDDTVVAGARGVASGVNDVGGTISGLATILAACTNMTMDQRVEQLMDGATTWNCGAMGLVVLEGEEVRTTIRVTYSPKTEPRNMVDSSH